MEELKCELLGFSSSSLRASFTTSSYAGSSTSNNVIPEPMESNWLSPRLRDKLHPTEVAMLEELLPLGRYCSILSNAARDAAVGRTEGLYASAVAAGVQPVLQSYTEDVKHAATPSALSVLRSTYELTFRLLAAIILEQQQSTDAVVQPALGRIQKFMATEEVPRPFRQSVGESVWRAVLYTTAHYVAHGLVLHGRRDYFISVTPARAGTPEGHMLHAELLPWSISVELASLILTAGKERRVLLTEVEIHGADYLEQLAMGAQDEAADAVFKAIFSISLWEGGVLAGDELTARVDAAKALWSKALWTKVGLQSPLEESLEALQNMFLCRRGDFWSSFVERSYDVLCGVQLQDASRGSTTLSSYATLPTTQRSVAEALSYAFGVSGLEDRSIYDSFRTKVGPDMPMWSQTATESSTTASDTTSSGQASSGSRSVEGLAVFILNRVAAVGLHFTVAQGLQLIVSPKALDYYERLFSFHLRMRFSLHALNLTRRLFSGAIVTNAKPSTALRRAYVLFQLLHFLLTTLSYYLQIDVIHVHAEEVQQAVKRCRSVQEAKRAHDRFLWRVAEGSFLTEGSQGIRTACLTLMECGATLSTLCTRYRLNYWAVAGVNATPIEVSASLTALETRVQQGVVAVFTGHLSASSHANERALWTRLDFCRYFSYKPPVITSVSEGRHTRTPSASIAFDLPQQRQTRSISAAGCRPSATTLISSVAAGRRAAKATVPDTIPKD